MTTHAPKPWIENVALHPDVLSEHFSEDVFALDLGPLAECLLVQELKLSTKGLPTVAAVYRDPEQFFRASYLTAGLRSLLADVLNRLVGGGGNGVLKLVTPFGGGKSHTLAALLHAARSHKALSMVPEARGLVDPGKVGTAVFDGQFFDAKTGKAVPGGDFRARTMWGWIAWALRGKEGYELLREQDEARVAPGADEILALLKDEPNLILLDEVLEYLISAGGVKVEKTTLRDETLSFIKRLTVAVANAKNTALVFSLQSSRPREALEYASLLQTIDHLAARKDQRREPVEGNEILSVIQRRLLAKLPDAEAATPAATGYQHVVTQLRRAQAHSAAEQQQAEDEGIALRDRIRSAYPFHPALIDLMRERWAAIPDFQRTRGALRFLASSLRAAHRDGRSRALLGPGDVPIQDTEVRQAFFKEVGQREDFLACLEHDFIGANARTRRIDERRAKEVPSEAGKRPATRLATAILLYSFGGLRREGSGEGDMLPPGITEPELLSVCIGPDLDSTTAQACLKELKEQCLYLHFDGVRYCFKKDPNVTLLIEQETESVARDEARVRARIKELLEERLAGQRTAVVWPSTTTEVPDHDASFLVAYMPFEFGTRNGRTRESEALDYFEKCGGKPRDFRNGIGLAVSTDDQTETLRRSVRYLLAIEQVRNKSKQLNLTDAQKDQIKEREATERAGAESALLKLYTEVWLPRVENGGIGIEVLAVGGRPLQTTLDEKKRALIHQRLVELLTHVQPRLFGTLNPSKIVELFKLGEGSPPRVGIRAAEVVSGFYSFLGFTRLNSDDAIRKTIAHGVEKRLFGYTTGSPILGGDGRYQIDRSKVVYDRPLAVDEVDLQSGFLIVPAALPVVAAQPPGTGPTPSGLAEGDRMSTGPVSGPQSHAGEVPRPPDAGLQHFVELAFSADRNQLFTAWNAVANLADMAGKVSVTVHASSDPGFDQSKLDNGVLEPLRETKLIE
jgi:hypothetical protein